MKTSLLAFTFFSASFGLQAAGTVDFLEVDNDVVLFSTSETKIGTSPACMASDNANLWSVSLASNSGRAIYSLILTAMAKDDNVGLNIQSAQDCADKTGLERASKVNLVATARNVSSGSSKSVGVYKADGTTHVGTLVDYVNYWDFHYVTNEAAWVPTHLQRYFTWEATWHLEPNCAGPAYIQKANSSPFLHNPYYNDGKFFSALPTAVKHNVASYMLVNGTCQEYVYVGINLYEITTIDTEHEICGFGPCKFKQD